MEETVYSKIHDEIISDLKTMILADYCKKQIGTAHMRKRMADYVNNSRSKVNIDALEIHFATGSNSSSTTIKEVRVLAGNLYTYVVLCGIEVPYYDWIYDEKFVHDDYIFKYNEAKNEYCHTPLVRQKRPQKL